MIDPTLRRKVAWLIGIRAVISTILLGSATFMQVTAPGSFAVDPFFFLIGLTYALTIGYALAFRFIEGHRWIVDLQLGIDALLVCRDELADEVVYQFTKEFFAALPKLAETNSEAANIDVETAPATPIPLHSGAARYYREREVLK